MAKASDDPVDGRTGSDADGPTLSERPGLCVFVCGSEEAVRAELERRLREKLGGTVQIRGFAGPENLQQPDSLFAADVAILITEAGKEVATTRQLLFLLAMFRVPSVVLAVDAAEPESLAPEAFASLLAEHGRRAQELGLRSLQALPISARTGENIPVRSARFAWSDAPGLAELVSRQEMPGHGEPAVELTTADQYAADLLWLADAPMVPGRDYLLRAGGAETVATVTELKHRINTDSLAREPAKTLRAGEVGLCNLSLHEPLRLDAYAHDRSAGSFVLRDRATARPVGLGTVEFALRRAANIRWQPMAVTKAARAEIKNQRPAVLWFTGLSASGKSTIASLTEQRLHALGLHTFVLDGDNVRHGLNRDLGFTEVDRVENIRRVAEVARLFAEAGLIVLVSFISPFRAERQMARELLAEDPFLEIFVDTPLGECRRRDPKGLYAKALRGDLKNFTGIDSPYEPPENPELRLETVGASPEELVGTIEALLRERGIITS